MLTYILIEIAVVCGLVIFVTLMCQVVAKRIIWPSQELHPSFVGSLLSASGTIFAASIAWVIADHNIQVQKSIAAEQTLKNDEQIASAWQQVEHHIQGLLNCFNGNITGRCIEIEQSPVTPAIMGAPLLNEVFAMQKQLDVLIASNPTGPRQGSQELLDNIKSLMFRAHDEVNAHQHPTN